MNRRELLGRLFGKQPKSKAILIAPDDFDKLRRFSDAYNMFVSFLARGERSVKQWSKVTTAWHDLNT